MRIAVYPGTFDPCTLAHINILKRACAMFDFVYVGVLTNTSKQPIFSVDERIAMLKICASEEGIENCDVIGFNGMLADFARNVNACATIRGLRNVSDFEAELSMCDINHRLNPALESVFLMSAPELRAISSSAVREIGKLGGALDGFIHSSVLNIITERLVQS